MCLPRRARQAVALLDVLAQQVVDVDLVGDDLVKFLDGNAVLRHCVTVTYSHCVVHEGIVIHGDAYRCTDVSGPYQSTAFCRFWLRLTACKPDLAGFKPPQT